MLFRLRLDASSGGEAGMALIKCKECGNEVSTKAETCPKCGARVARKPLGCGSAIGVIVLAAVILSVFGSLFKDSSHTPSSSPQTTPVAATSQTDPPVPKASGSQWSYQ